MILLFKFAVLSLGLALESSSVAVNLSVGYVPDEGIAPKKSGLNFKVTLPDAYPLEESVDAAISTCSEVTYITSPATTSGASPAFKTVTIKLLSLKETNICEQ